MATSITVGKARIFPVTLFFPDNTVDTGTMLTQSMFGTGDPAVMRVTLNPSNNREFAVVGLAPTPGTNANLTVNGHTASTLITVVVAPVQNSSPAIGVGGPEIDPPSWA